MRAALVVFGVALFAAACVSSSPRGDGSASVPRPVALERQAIAVPDWTFYYSMENLPGEAWGLVLRFVGSKVASPGQPFNTTDAINLRLPNAQLQLAAAADDLTVIVWIANGGIAAPSLNMLIYDRTMRDACRYTFSSPVPRDAIRLSELLGMLPDRASQAYARREYLGPGLLPQPWQK
jgi:hypothetical protein